MSQVSRLKFNKNQEKKRAANDPDKKDLKKENNSEVPKETAVDAPSHFKSSETGASAKPTAINPKEVKTQENKMNFQPL